MKTVALHPSRSVGVKQRRVLAESEDISVVLILGACCVILGRTFTLSEPQFFHLYVGDSYGWWLEFSLPLENL